MDLDEKLSEHFTLREFVESDTAKALGIDNTPEPGELEKLHWLAGRLEQVRELLGPLRINSGRRCLALNRAVGSKDTSQHVQDEAIDCVMADQSMTPLEMCQEVAASPIHYDQLICEHYDPETGKGWMHISFVRHREPRLMALTITKSGAASRGLPVA